MEVLTIFDRRGFSDYKRWQRENPEIVKRINWYINSIQRDGPLKGPGRPERLERELKGAYSRMIDYENRLTYNVSKDAVAEKIIITSCMTHYKGRINPKAHELLDEGFNI